MSTTSRVIVLVVTVLFTRPLHGVIFTHHHQRESRDVPQGAHAQDTERGRDMNAFLNRVGNPWREGQKVAGSTDKRQEEGWLDDDIITAERAIVSGNKQSWTGSERSLTGSLRSASESLENPPRSDVQNRELLPRSLSIVSRSRYSRRRLGRRRDGRRRVGRRHGRVRGNTRNNRQHSMFDSTEERERKPILDIFEDKFKRQQEMDSNSASSFESSESQSTSSSEAGSESREDETNNASIVQRGLFSKKKKGPKRHPLRKREEPLESTSSSKLEPTSKPTSDTGEDGRDGAVVKKKRTAAENWDFSSKIDSISNSRIKRALDSLLMGTTLRSRFVIKREAGVTRKSKSILGDHRRRATGQAEPYSEAGTITKRFSHFENLLEFLNKRHGGSPVGGVSRVDEDQSDHQGELQEGVGGMNHAAYRNRNHNKGKEEKVMSELREKMNHAAMVNKNPKH